MQNGLYHKDVYWPQQLNNFFDTRSFKEIIFTEHVKEQERNAANRLFDLKDITLDFVKKGEIFEMEIRNNNIVKIVTRCKYKGNSDLCIVLGVNGNSLQCRTAYLNEHNDIHCTLNATKYIQSDKEQKSNNNGFYVLLSELTQHKNKKN